MCGFISGDGHIKIRQDKKEWFHHEIRFFPDNLDVAILFTKTFNKLYEKEPSIKQLKNHYRVRVTSKIACEHLLKLSNYGTYSWKVPDFMIMDNAAKIEFLRAIFDCVSHV